MNKQTLEKAITKAIENGWDWPLEHRWESWEVTQEDQDNAFVLSPYVHFEAEDEDDLDWQQDCLVLLYSHDFAKALWGEEYDYQQYDDDQMWEMAWKYHLQQMVIADDPIRYLEENI